MPCVASKSSPVYVRANRNWQYWEPSKSRTKLSEKKNTKRRHPRHRKRLLSAESVRYCGLHCDSQREPGRGFDTLILWVRRPLTSQSKPFFEYCHFSDGKVHLRATASHFCCTHRDSNPGKRSTFDTGRFWVNWPLTYLWKPFSEYCHLGGIEVHFRATISHFCVTHYYSHLAVGRTFDTAIFSSRRPLTLLHKPLFDYFHFYDVDDHLRHRDSYYATGRTFHTKLCS